MVKIVRLTVTAREGGLEAQAKLDVVVKDVNDNEPKFEVIISFLVNQYQLCFRWMNIGWIRWRLTR